MDEPTSEGKQHIDRWMGAQRELQRCKSSLNSAECEMTNATNALGKWMLPNDAQDGEKFAGYVLEKPIYWGSVHLLSGRWG